MGRALSYEQMKVVKREEKKLKKKLKEFMILLDPRW